jgi:SAM-dependent methyltransferase
MNLSETIHESYGFGRRVRVLSDHIQALLPENASVLDVGCGDGTIDRIIQDLRPDLELRGIDVLVRPDTKIPVDEFDGIAIPHSDGSFDAVVFVDVLHHSDDATQLLREAKRVARQCIIIKDHRLDGLFAGPTLRFMDDVGNRRHGVRLPYNYWSHDEWRAVFGGLGLTIESWTQHLGMYPWPASMFFGRGLHFLARLGTQSQN